MAASNYEMNAHVTLGKARSNSKGEQSLKCQAHPVPCDSRHRKKIPQEMEQGVGKQQSEESSLARAANSVTEVRRSDEYTQ